MKTVANVALVIAVGGVVISLVDRNWAAASWAFSTGIWAWIAGKAA